MPPYSNYSDEYLRHPLYRIARAAAMRRARYICEDCTTARATETHHVHYPAWGAFDTPSNLRAVCHDCHCIAEGKPH
jgi:hypothetical protein